MLRPRRLRPLLIGCNFAHASLLIAALHAQCVSALYSVLPVSDKRATHSVLHVSFVSPRRLVNNRATDKILANLPRWYHVIIYITNSDLSALHSTAWRVAKCRSEVRSEVSMVGIKHLSNFSEQVSCNILGTIIIVDILVNDYCRTFTCISSKFVRLYIRYILDSSIR